MGRRLVIFAFGVMALAVGLHAIDALAMAVDERALGAWLVAAYAVLKLAVAVAFTAFVIVRGPALRRTRRPIAYLVCGAVLVPALLGDPSDTAPPALVVVGELIAVGGCAWMLVAALALGRCFGVLPEARGLVTHGPYALVRHPLYLGELGAMAGLLVASPSPRNLLAGAAFAAAQVMRMRLEESALTREFPEYADYAARTPRIVPALPRAPALQPAGERGQAMVEYAMILGFVAAVVFVVLSPLGTAVGELIEPVVGRL